MADRHPPLTPFEVSSAPRAEVEGSPPWALAGARAELMLHPEGLRLSRAGVGRSAQLVPYHTITHVSVGTRGIWIGTRRGVVALRRGLFRQRRGPEALRDALLSKIARQPQGLSRLARFAELDRLLRRPPRRVAGGAVAVVCVAVFALQLTNPFAEEAGAFIPSLVGQGEFWRVLTGNFFHRGAEFPLHLAVNLLGLLFLTLVVERPLGALRTIVIMGASAVGAMGACAVAGYVGGVVGSSGIVFGLLGAALCLEHHRPDDLPVWWRLPRALIYLVVVWEVGAALAFPFIAGAAHLGGFAAGYGMTWLVVRHPLREEQVSPWIAWGASAVALATLLSFAAAGPLILGRPGALERYGERLLEGEAAPAYRLNNLAWRLVTAPEHTELQLVLARDLAERAVEKTERLNPDWLDTLAEVLFARGERAAAVSAIDEAIRLAPGERYFVEQRRRFTGEREPADRPPPPGEEFWPEFDRSPVPEWDPRAIEI